MLKLFVATLILSDTGSVATSLAITDYDDPVACECTARELENKGHFTKDINGHAVTITTSAQCRPAQSGRPVSECPPPGYRMPSYATPPAIPPGYRMPSYVTPPAIRGMVEGFLRQNGMK